MRGTITNHDDMDVFIGTDAPKYNHHTIALARNGT